MKHPKIYRCELCGDMYAVLPVTIHYSSAYHPHYCEECGKLINSLINLVKKDIKRTKWK